MDPHPRGAPEDVPPIPGSRPADAEAFRSAFEDAPIGMSFVDVSPGRLGEFVRVNEALAQLTGYPRATLIGMAYATLTHPDDIQEDDDRMRELICGAIPRYQIEKRYVHAHGHVVWVAVTVSLVRSETGAPLYAIRQVVDIGVRKHLEGELSFLADHDPLTGLFNRRRFTRELSRRLAYARRYGGGGVVAVLDLDHLKQLNDEFGHKAGDDAIVATAQLLRTRLRTTDIVARLGGDEFALALPHTDQRQAQALCEELLRATRQQSGVAGGRGHRLTLSIGMASFGDDPEVTDSDLLVRADVAMYEAKTRGGHACVTYDAAAGAPDGARVPRVGWSARIREAIDADTLVLHCQPIVELATGQTTQCELLLRMQDGTELLPPAAFLHTAERLGLAREIDRWVIHRALTDIPARPGRLLTLNLSSDSITDTGLPAFIEHELAAGGRAASSFVFEVTESAAIADMDRARTLITRISGLGCRIALDHFGSALGSFYYLKYLPLDFLKIDGSFVRGLCASRVDRALLTAIVTMAHELGQQVIAEHVEDAGTVEVLRSLGVDHGQGFHLGRPVPLTAC